MRYITLLVFFWGGGGEFDGKNGLPQKGQNNSENVDVVRAFSFFLRMRIRFVRLGHNGNCITHSTGGRRPIGRQSAGPLRSSLPES